MRLTLIARQTHQLALEYIRSGGVRLRVGPVICGYSQVLKESFKPKLISTLV